MKTQHATSRLMLFACAATGVWMVAAVLTYLLRGASHNWFFWLLRPYPPRWAYDLESQGMASQPEILGAEIWLVLVSASALLLGRGLVRWIQPRLDRVAAWTLGGGLGLGALGTGVFVLGIAHQIALPRLRFPLLLLVAAGMSILFLRRQEKADAPRLQFSRTEWALIVVVALVQFLALFYALTPAVQSDGIRYHLAGPQEWLKIGGIDYLPYNSFTNFPGTLDMLFMLGLGLDGDLLAKGMHWLFLPLSTLLVGLLTREIAPGARLAGMRASALAASFWGTLPVTIPLAGWAFIDLGTAFFALATVFLTVRWVRTRDPRDWVLGAVFCGLFVASKYTGILVAVWGGVIVGLGGLFAFEDGEARFTPRLLSSAFMRALWFGLIAAAFGAPWWLRNVVNTGNPVYPLAWDVFGGGEWSAVSEAIYKGKLASKGMGHGLRDFFALPWRVTAQSDRFGGFDIGPVLWVVFPVVLGWCAWALGGLRRRLDFAALALWAGFLIVSWFLTYQSNRFLLPFIGVSLAVACAALVQIVPVCRNRVSRAIPVLLVLLTLFYGLAASVFWLLLDEGRITRQSALAVRWPAYTLGAIDRDTYLAGRLNYYTSARFAVAQLPDDARVFLLGEHRKFHWQVPVAGRNWEDPPMILEYLRAATDADAVLDALRADGFTHIFLNLNEWGWPQDPRRQLGQVPPTPGSAWYFNMQHFSRPQLRVLREIIGSPRLRPVKQSEPGRVYLAEILPRP